MPELPGEAVIFVQSVNYDKHLPVPVLINYMDWYWEGIVYGILGCYLACFGP